ncbi:membrane protein involved in the export of O-antigen and teichoic acid [gamma proteobacterium HIMB55]|nr:membrane protein involved in the export of O-antigen and teichoic acid [gamma proteobacterium HIMB55]
MKNYSAFVGGITRLLLGSGLAQGITIAATLVSARLYSPESFSNFGIYVASTSLLLTVFTGRLDLALIQVSSTAEYRNLLSATLVILLTSSLSFLILGYQIYGFKPAGGLVVLIFLGLISNGLSQIYSNLFSSQERYGEIGVLRIISATTFMGFSIGFSRFADGLIVASIVSQFLSAVLHLIRSNIPLVILDWTEFKSVINEYRDYWTTDTLSSLLNTLGRQLPALLFPSMFGGVIAGHYFFCQRIVAAPVNLVANSVGNVFRKGATKEYEEHGNFESIFIFSFMRLLLLAAFGVFFALFFINDKNLTFLFGNQWSGIADILKLVVIFYAFKFAISPLTYSLYVVRKLHWNFYGQLLYLGCLFIPLLVAWYFDCEPKTAVAWHVLGACIAYTGYLGISYFCARKGADL